MSIAAEIQAPSHDLAIDGAKASLISHLKTRAPSYFPGLDATAVTMRHVRESRRMYSAFHEFELSDGNRSHGVIVKFPYMPTLIDESAKTDTISQRPRLFELVDPDRMAELEFNSLVAIEQHFNALGDPRFGVIRPLELLTPPNAFAMEKQAGVSFRQIHLTARRVKIGWKRLPFQPLETTQNAGDWLREFHQIGPLSHTTDRMATRAEFLEVLAALTANLIDQGENRPFIESVRSQLESAAQRSLDSQFELAIAHGDFAPRNLLIEPNNRVTVIDTLARWRAPIFEDLAMFQLGLRASAAQVVSLGTAYDRASLDRLENQFLTRYFDGAPIPMASIRIFEGLLLLERWGAFAQRARLLGAPSRRIYHRWRLVTLRQFVKQYFRHTLRELDQLR